MICGSMFVGYIINNLRQFYCAINRGGEKVAKRWRKVIIAGWRKGGGEKPVYEIRAFVATPKTLFGAETRRPLISATPLRGFGLVRGRPKKINPGSVCLRRSILAP